MIIQRLSLNNFRNIEQAELTPGPDFNIIWGENAQGKTNLIEGIYLLGNLKSFRRARNGELIRHETSRARIAGYIENRQVSRRMDLMVTREGKRAQMDGKEVKNAAHFFGFLCPVLFSPEEVSLVKGSPAGRRSLLDRALFQSDPTYLNRAQKYDRCLRQRNQLLREGREPRQIEPWTEGLIAAGARIRWDRSRYLGKLSPLLRKTYANISDGREEADLDYRQGGSDETQLQKILRDDLIRLGERERQLGQTLAGPHRDDPLFLIGGRSLQLFGSQGQQRSYILAFKTAQVMEIEARTGEPPVLLLDDMTSELDKKRQGYFFRFLLERRGQVFISTTDIRHIISEGIDRGRFFRVDGGKIEENRTS